MNDNKILITSPLLSNFAEFIMKYQKLTNAAYLIKRK